MCNRFPNFKASCISYMVPLFVRNQKIEREKMERLMMMRMIMMTLMRKHW